MSWEELSKITEKCECGKGCIVSVVEMDDWNNSRSKTSISCKECYEKALEYQMNSFNCPNPVKQDNTEYFYIGEK